MAVGFKTWTVLEHDPIEELASNLWRVEGRLGKTNRRVMALARLKDGRIIVHNAIALDDASMKKIDAWGEVAAILVPNSFHRQDAFIMQQRYPNAKVYAPKAAMGAAAKATPVAGAYEDAPMDDTIELRTIHGIGDREGVMMVKSDDGTSAVFCDTLLNLPKMGGLFGVFLHPTGMLSVPRATRMIFMKDKRTLADDLTSIAATKGLIRIVPGHGKIIATEADARMREAAERLLA